QPLRWYRLSSRANETRPRASTDFLRDLSDIDLGAEFDDAIRRDPEELGRPRREPREDDVQALTPAGHSGPRRRFDVGAPDEEGDFVEIQVEPRDFRAAELARHVRRLGEPEMCVDLPKAAAKLARRHPVGTRDPR